MAKLKLKIGFIGVGNMGEAIVGAIIKAGIFDSSMICVSDISDARLHVLGKKYGVKTMKDNFMLFSQSDIVLLAVKPQQIDQMLSQIAAQKNFKVPNRKLVISIAAGIPISKIENLLYAPLDKISAEKLPIIRVMPNTPALVLAGISGMSSNKFAGAEDIKTARKILEAMGKVIEFNEEDLDGVTALSGSGPAYVFYLVEAMVEGGIAVGLNREDAATLTLSTLSGSIKLMTEQNESPERLRKKVTSPGGTTEAAFMVMTSHRVKESIIKAIAAAARRSKELSS